jgi:outer membrane protein OmpA-like peptidoglycan-associated protein
MKRFLVLFEVTIQVAFWFVTLEPTMIRLAIADTVMSDEIARQLAPEKKFRSRAFRRVKEEAPVVKEEKKEEKQIARKLNFEIHFAANSANIQKESYDQLSEIAKALNSDSLKTTRILVEGHTDSVGNIYQNQKLSEQRAISVRNYLIDKGVNASRLSFEGKGESDPIASNDTAKGRMKNRRVTLVNQGS